MQNTREIAAAYRLTHWAGILHDRTTSGLSIRSYCKEAGFHENIYYYWQRKLRAAGAALLQSAPTLTTESTMNPEPETAPLTKPNLNPQHPGPVPSGWLACPPAMPTEGSSVPALTIEVNHCRITVSANTDIELLSKVCRALAYPC